MSNVTNNSIPVRIKQEKITDANYLFCENNCSNSFNKNSGNNFYTYKTVIHVKSKELSVIVFVHRKWCHVRVFLLTSIFA